ncbi:Sec-independent protein translocase protein TatB [Burkholderia pseudomallei]|uniref:Sec-independent protein translocase protein TatB n=4 Tax=Burkholderia pseudomallei TaxID=28450 RepID=TATB_BURPS|nr:MULTISPECIES: Sec-independent protein translocase protein TatB [Burkholderia]A3P021.1 RecName: Full=Sec-independent protein translocase protein TatB [Burkholderia pseudomallei 1106a]Q63Q98.1 RecName: Full=Sec-independent protein translocase protein TatB [Burkholderia pseudomallei K96243]EIF52190.1 twin arginine translocase protein B [Burkholderia pseudomallei 1258a]KGW49612.1 twin arginine-targeting protein translocase TatB [Burkholderia pseudomallei MSHR684]KGX75303.1 twin arginine-targeti
MLDLGLSKMALIGVVALVVLGPERLPRVARTAGALFGRAQRYINDVKAEVSREIELDALRTMKTDFEQAARNVENTIHDNLREHERDLNAAWNSAVSPGGSAAADAPDGPSAASGEPSWRTIAAAPAKRRNWRVKKAVTPVWYKRATMRRTQVQSGAARVARHRPASLRRPARFL